MKSNDFLRPTPAEEADLFPFGPVQPDPENRPVLLHDVCLAIRSIGGEIWTMNRFPDGSGLLLNVGIEGKKGCVFTPMPGRDPQPTAPTGKGSPCHIVTTLPDLQIWLEALAAV